MFKESNSHLPSPFSKWIKNAKKKKNQRNKMGIFQDKGKSFRMNEFRCIVLIFLYNLNKKQNFKDPQQRFFRRLKGWL